MALRGIDRDLEIATVLGINKGSLTNKMKGRRPWSLDDIAKLALYFRVSESAFVGEVQSIVEPGNAATGTSGWKSDYHQPERQRDGKVLRFPQVARRTRVYRELATVTPIPAPGTTPSSPQLSPIGSSTIGVNCEHTNRTA